MATASTDTIDEAPAEAPAEVATAAAAMDTAQPPPAPTPDTAPPLEPTAVEPPPAEPAVVPAPSPAPPALCHAWGDLSASEADRLAQRLRRIGITAARSRSETPEAWWVRIPPQRNRSEAERRVVELNLLGVSDTFIVQESGPNQNAVSLGLFKTENRARILLGQLRAKGVENAGIEPRMATSYRIQASVPANELRIVESAAPGLRARRQACTR
jgi:cell division protein FtsN